MPDLVLHQELRKTKKNEQLAPSPHNFSPSRWGSNTQAIKNHTQKMGLQNIVHYGGLIVMKITKRPGDHFDFFWKIDWLLGKKIFFTTEIATTIFPKTLNFP